MPILKYARNETRDSTCHMHDHDTTYYADDKANSFTDNKDQCNDKGADSSRKSIYYALPLCKQAW